MPSVFIDGCLAFTPAANLLMARVNLSSSVLGSFPLLDAFSSISLRTCMPIFEGAMLYTPAVSTSSSLTVGGGADFVLVVSVPTFSFAFSLFKDGYEGCDDDEDG